MNISLLNDSYKPTIDGVANVVENYAVSLRTLGHGVQVITPSHPEADDSASPWEVVRYPSIDTRRAIGYVTGFPFSVETLRSVKQFAPDLLHTHCPISSEMMALALQREVKVPLVLTYHTKYDIDFAKALKNKYLTKLAVNALVSMINGVDEVWTVSRGAGESLRSIGYRGAYTVMPNGVDMPRTAMTAEEIASHTAGAGVPQDAPLFLFVGRLMWYKGIRIILDALAKLKAEGRPFRMVFIGGGTDEQEIRAYTQERNLTDRVHFIGKIADRRALAAWYCRANLMLFPSTFDTNGLVVREAAACSLAAVLIKDSCASEGVTDGGNGFLIEENADALYACLRALPPSKMAEVGENACRDLYYSWTDAVKAAADRYPTVIENYKSGVYRHESHANEIFKLAGQMMDLSEKVKDFVTIEKNFD